MRLSQLDQSAPLPNRVGLGARRADNELRSGASAPSGIRGPLQSDCQGELVMQQTDLESEYRSGPHFEAVAGVAGVSNSGPAKNGATAAAMDPVAVVHTGSKSCHDALYKAVMALSR